MLNKYRQEIRLNFQFELLLLNWIHITNTNQKTLNLFNINEIMIIMPDMFVTHYLPYIYIFYNNIIFSRCFSGVKYLFNKFNICK